MKMNNQQWIYICSDSMGKTAEAVAEATIRQFQMTQVRIKRYTQLQDEEEIKSIVNEAAVNRALIIYTLVQPELREMIKLETALHHVHAVDIMGPAMMGFVGTFHEPNRPAAIQPHEVDDDYYRRIEALEYTVRNDDGKSLTELDKADILILGVSRTSKTPLSIYLAHKGYKTANIPIVPEVRPPDILLQLPKHRIIGLTMQAEKLVSIREARLQDLGLSAEAQYAEITRVEHELEHAHHYMERIGCRIIDITNRAIEETSELIIEHINSNYSYS